MPPSTRMTSAFIYGLVMSSMTMKASSSPDPRRLGYRTDWPRWALKSIALLTFSVDRGVDQARGDGVDPYADRRQVPCHGEGHSDDAPLGGRVGGLTDLTVEGGN
ncbi:MAG: hypothetical protein Ct9H300mP12_11590 [Acidimicrobiales bacterium]|nr:MAG: hypothetical protein Ct9H300mP12_11590 [Acidimicrobiales bacterium]